MAKSLKRCPFCGGKAAAGGYKCRTCNRGDLYVECQICGLMIVSTKSRSDAALQWNTRAYEEEKNGGGEE